MVADAAQHLEWVATDKLVEHDPDAPGGYLIVLSIFLKGFKL